MQATRSSLIAWAASRDQHPIFLLIVAYAGACAPLSLSMMPLLVHVWIRQLGVSESTVGYLAAVASVGGALGLFTSGWIAPRTKPQRTALLGLMTAVGCDLASIAAWNTVVLGTLRFVGGCGAGLAMGVFIGWFARHKQADRCFGMFSLYQFGLAGIAMALMPSLEARLGLPAIYITLVFLGLIACVASTLLAIEHPRVVPAAGITGKRTPFRFSWAIALLVVVGTVYNLFAHGLWTYNELYGLSLGYSKKNLDFALAAGSASGIVGTLSMIIIGDRFGRLKPIFLSLFVFIFAILSINVTTLPFNLLALQFIATSLAWSFGWPYVQAVQSELDSTGRLAIYCTVAAALGNVAGPAIFGFLIHGDNFHPAFRLSLAASILCTIMLIAPTVRAERIRAARLRAPQ